MNNYDDDDDADHDERRQKKSKLTMKGFEDFFYFEKTDYDDAHNDEKLTTTKNLRRRLRRNLGRCLRR